VPRGTDISWPQGTDRNRGRRCKISGRALAPVVPALAVVDTNAAKDSCVRCGLDALGDNTRVASLGEIDE